MKTLPTVNTNTAIPAITLVIGLFDSIDYHQYAVDATHYSYTARDSALKALRDAGYTSVKDGRSKAKIKANEVPNDKALASFFNERFIRKAKAQNILASEYSVANGGDAMEYLSPTEVQIATNLKHQISFLNHYLKTGVFTTHVGREKAKSEEFETSKLIAEAEAKAKADQTKADKAKQALLALANKAAKEKSILEAKVLADKAEAEATLLAHLEAEAEALLLAEQLAADKEHELTKAKPSKAKLALIVKAETAHAKEQATKQAEADRATKQAEADKAEAVKAEADKAALLLANEVMKAAADKILADKVAAQSLAEARKLIAEADKKKADKKPAISETQLIKNILASCKANMTKDGLEKLADGLADLIDSLS